MFKANENFLKLPGSYLFSTVAKKNSGNIVQHIRTRRLSGSVSVTSHNRLRLRLLKDCIRQ